ncbi:MAG: hypothetical protein IKF52_04925 [Clostridia bacterium]|nr:hypothetical protein [Clostridia bacterium]
MRLSDHYSSYRMKKIKPHYFLFILLLFLLPLILFNTFGRYFNKSQGYTSFDFAKWFLVINDEEVESNRSDLNGTIQLINSEDGTTKIDIGDECYFDIIINPSSTEVAINNSIYLNLKDGNSNLPDGTIIKKYEKYNNSTSDLLSSTDVNNTTLRIDDNIYLSNNHNTLDNADSLKYRIYCQIPEYADLFKNQELSVTPIISVKQILGNE